MGLEMRAIALCGEGEKECDRATLILFFVAQSLLWVTIRYPLSPVAPHGLHNNRYSGTAPATN